ncbi:hypothetical protein [Erwinia aphidicola]|uniref:Uncharacterized protein n=1 Tax=Erwinia aphidicola TaxID=68334 RepID=A0ABU8DMB6_ERWAP
MTKIIERNRSRLVNIYLAELVRKTGSMSAVTELPDGSLTTVALDAEIVTKALHKLFESAVRRVSSATAADSEIAETYSECVKIKTGKLSAFGEGFMGALISNLVEQAFAVKDGFNDGE